MPSPHQPKLPSVLQDPEQISISLYSLSRASFYPSPTSSSELSLVHIPLAIILFTIHLAINHILSYDAFTVVGLNR